jgi:3',5'-cyclic AMP phosphodiesterase CpdA
MGRSWLRFWVLLGGFIGFGCAGDSGSLLPEPVSPAPVGAEWVLVARLAHISDTHVLDEESPARFAGAHSITRSAWRPYEGYSTQLLDGMLRTVNRIHASGRTIDFLLHSGDACDNAQSNELGWLTTLFDGGEINPRTGPDDRSPESRPPPELDPHAPFRAAGLYRQGVHGSRPSIPWYAVVGNHDVYSIGVFPIIADADGHRVATLPLDWRPGWVLPVILDPTAAWSYGRVTPAAPGPPGLFTVPGAVEPNASRAYFSKDEYLAVLSATATGPAGHGFASATSYSVSPVPGLRLIGLDTTDRAPPAPGALCSEGAFSRSQLDYLRRELEAARGRNELVIVATHHPSVALLPLAGSEVDGDEFRGVLAEYDHVVVHLCGHMHRHRVTQRDTYLEIETGATLDPPQEGRVVEVWRDSTEGRIAVAYEVFSHLDETLPPLGDDSLRGLREQAQRIAADEKTAPVRRAVDDGPTDGTGTARPGREGWVLLTSPSSFVTP